MITKKPLVVIAGPTAVGKTKLSIQLAKAIDGEIISADSMQVYKGCDIGSAKITTDEMQGIRHHLIDVLDPKDEFNIATFKDMATKAIEDITSRGKIPIVVGGTGFYVRALIYDTDFDSQDGADKEFRTECEEYAKKFGNEALFERLRAVDPKSCETIHMNNVKRVIRALEFFETTHSPISQHNEEMRQNEAAYNFAYFVLSLDRDILYSRINDRVDQMLDAGLIDEVKRLKESGLDRSFVSMQGLGYKEIFAYLEGECSIDEALEIIKRDTRHFAKRQFTWYKRERDAIWIDKGKITEAEILDFVLNTLEEKQIYLGER